MVHSHRMKMDGLLRGTEDSHPIHNYAYCQPNPGKKDWIYKMKRVKGTQVALAKCSKCPRQGNARCPKKLCAQCCREKQQEEVACMGKCKQHKLKEQKESSEESNRRPDGGLDSSFDRDERAAARPRSEP